MSPSTRNLFAYVVMAAGVMIAAAGGLCTLSVAGPAASDLLLGKKPLWSEALGMVAFCLFIGAIPMSMGVGLFVAGRSLRKPTGD